MPVVTIRCRPKTSQQRENVAHQVIKALAAEFDLPPDRVQVFFDEYDDAHWFRGAAGVDSPPSAARES